MSLPPNAFLSTAILRAERDLLGFNDREDLSLNYEDIIRRAIAC